MMPMPEQITLASVNAAIAEANITTDNHVMEEHYTSELHDIYKEVKLMPGKDRVDMHNDQVNGPVPIRSYVDLQDELLSEVVLK